MPLRAQCVIRALPAECQPSFHTQSILVLTCPSGSHAPRRSPAHAFTSDRLFSASPCLNPTPMQLRSQNGTNYRVRQLCGFLCHPEADQINVMSIEVNTGSYEYSNITPLRQNSWLPLPYPTKWHMDWRWVQF